MKTVPSVATAKYTLGCNTAPAIASSPSGPIAPRRTLGIRLAPSTKAPAPAIPLKNSRRLTFSIRIMSSPDLLLGGNRLKSVQFQPISYLHSDPLQVTRGGPHCFCKSLPMAPPMFSAISRKPELAVAFPAPGTASYSGSRPLETSFHIQPACMHLRHLCPPA